MDNSLFKSFLTAGAELLSNVKNVSMDEVVTDIAKLQDLQTKLLNISDFNQTLSDAEMVFDFTTNTITNSSGSIHNLISNSITGLNNIKLKNINITSTNAITGIDITLDDPSATPTWTEIGTNVDYTIGDASVNGFTFRIRSDDNVFSQVYLTYDMI